MSTISAREAAYMRMAADDEARQLKEGQNNPSPLQGAAYPMMMYRKTEAPDLNIINRDKDGKVSESEPINRFDGLLCDTCIAMSATEAEALAEIGWDTSAKAAHGIQSGLVAATSAKDDEIAALKAQIASMQSSEPEPEPERRGPGRPRLTPAA